MESMIEWSLGGGCVCGCCMGAGGYVMFSVVYKTCTHTASKGCGGFSTIKRDFIFSFCIHSFSKQYYRAS